MNVGEIFDGRYKLIRRLGSGGFSEVWLAADMQVGDLQVALKIYGINDSLSERDRRMFSSKFSLVYNLSHTNILTPRAFGEFDGMPYLVMPYCSRGSCSQLVGRATEPETWKFMRDVARGLAYLHSSNIIHMDIKPENVMITQTGTYVITDFDIAVNASGTVHLGADRAAGTPAYMAPERFGNGAVSIKASDIWALGASLYELLTGDVPFGDMGGLHQKSGAHVPAIRKSISNELRDIIDRCLQQVAWERPSAQQLADGILPPPPLPPPPPPPPWIIAIITALIVVVTGFWYIFGTGGNGEKPPGGETETVVDPTPKSDPELEAKFNHARNKAIENYEFADRMDDPDYYKDAWNYCQEALSLKPDDKEMKELKQKIETKL